MRTRTNLNRKHWFEFKVSPSNFQNRREPYLQYDHYTKTFEEFLDSFNDIEKNVVPYPEKFGLARMALITRIRVDNILNWGSIQYSAGAPVELFSEIWSQAMVWTEEFAEFNSAFNNSPEARGPKTPHIILASEEYWLRGLRLVCFGLLTGNAGQMTRVMDIMDYGNPHDGLIERMIEPFAPGRPTPPDTSTRHLPYRKLFKVFDAMPEQRPYLMTQYLDEWYHASRREPYVDKHNTSSFYGYWSWEAAAVTWLLEIDDINYRNMPFFPRDLVEFSRHIPRTPDIPPSPTYAGQPCPRSGYWFTLAQHDSSRRFERGEILPVIHSDDSNGFILWQWSKKQSE